jgi:hypothetical protein
MKETPAYFTFCQNIIWEAIIKSKLIDGDIPG